MSRSWGRLAPFDFEKEEERLKREDSDCCVLLLCVQGLQKR